MAYSERGVGKPILFLHGNPTSSYIWRNVLPALESQGRLIALDLIGMGDSQKLPDPSTQAYKLTTHRDHLWSFIDAVIGVDEDILIVGHDWGAVLGFDWAFHHRDRIRGFAYMETIVRNFTPADGSSELGPTFMALRSSEGEDLILNQNIFVERILPQLILRKLSEDEMNAYRRPFLDHDGRWPTLAWPRQIPIAGEPADVVAIVENYANWLPESEFPKLFISANPGAILLGGPREFCRTWKNQTEVEVSGKHFIQEDSGAEIGRAIANWIQEKELS